MLRALLTTMFVLALVTPSSASAQCRTSCRRGESRDPWGCCVPAARQTRRTRTPSRTRPETLVGDRDSVLSNDVPTELFHWGRAWLSRARQSEPRDHARAIEEFRRAAGASLIFLRVAPEDTRAGRMRAVLVQALDGAGMSEAGEREAASLGGARPSPEPGPEPGLRADTLLNMAWAHEAMGQSLDVPRAGLRRHELALARFARAAAYYRFYVAWFPDRSEAPGARSSLANALIASGRALEAASVLEQMAADVPGRRVEGLRRAVGAYQRALDADLAAARVEIRDAPPEPSQRPPWTSPPSMPEPLARLFDARERYLIATETSPEPALFRGQRLENAAWLFRYARFERARPRLISLLIERCDDVIAQEAEAMLREITDDAPPACELARAFVCAGSVNEPRCEPRPDAPADR